MLIYVKNFSCVYFLLHYSTTTIFCSVLFNKLQKPAYSLLTSDKWTLYFPLSNKILGIYHFSITFCAWRSEEILSSAFTCSKQQWKHQSNVYKIFSKLTIKTPELRHWRHAGVFIISFEQISHIALMFLLLTLNK